MRSTTKAVSASGRHYRQFSNISAPNPQNIIVSRFVLQLSLLNALKPVVKLRMKM